MGRSWLLDLLVVDLVVTVCGFSSILTEKTRKVDGRGGGGGGDG